MYVVSRDSIITQSVYVTFLTIHCICEYGCVQAFLCQLCVCVCRWQRLWLRSSERHRQLLEARTRLNDIALARYTYMYIENAHVCAWYIHVHTRSLYARYYKYT